jgi:hypothetical protein
MLIGPSDFLLGDAMSDTVLALGITVLLLLGLVAWVPLLHAADRLADRLAGRREPVHGWVWRDEDERMPIEAREMA